MGGEETFTLLELLSATGDGATVALVLILWRFDRRILTIENFIATLKEKKNERLA